MREITKKAVDLLSRLIETQSYSGEEQETADILSNYLRQHGYEVNQKGNNVWALSNHQDSTKPTLLLNFHHDTVHATSKWINDPFKANLLEGKLIGLEVMTLVDL